MSVLSPPRSLPPQQIKRGAFVINQGEIGHHFYTVWSGSLSIYILQGEAPPDLELQQELINTGDDRYLRVATMGPGKSFGELALM